MHTICADLGSTTTKIIEVDENNKIINKNIYQKEEPKKLLKKSILHLIKFLALYKSVNYSNTKKSQPYLNKFKLYNSFLSLLISF